MKTYRNSMGPEKGNFHFYLFFVGVVVSPKCYIYSMYIVIDCIQVLGTRALSRGIYKEGRGIKGLGGEGGYNFSLCFYMNTTLYSVH